MSCVLAMELRSILVVKSGHGRICDWYALVDVFAFVNGLPLDRDALNVVMNLTPAFSPMVAGHCFQSAQDSLCGLVRSRCDTSLIAAWVQS